MENEKRRKRSESFVTRSLTVCPISPEGDCRGTGESGEPNKERSGADEGGHDLMLREAGKPPRAEPGAIQGGAGAHSGCLYLQM